MKLLQREKTLLLRLRLHHEQMVRQQIWGPYAIDPKAHDIELMKKLGAKGLMQVFEHKGRVYYALSKRGKQESKPMLDALIEAKKVDMERLRHLQNRKRKS
jgi:hypothetical protein